MTTVPSAATLRQLLALSEKREALEAEIAKVEAQIKAALTGEKTAATPPASPVIARKTRDKKGKRGAVKTIILEALKAAGDAGTSVKDLAAKLGIKGQNVHVWFNTTGKKLTEVEKTGRGFYRFAAAKTEPAPGAHSATPAKKVVPKAKKPRKGKGAK